MSPYLVRLIKVFFFLFLSVLPVEAKEQKQVLIIYSQDRWHPAHELTEKGLCSVLDQNGAFDIQLHVEYLDLAHFSSSAKKKALTEYIRKKYEDLRIDSIITVYDTALYFIANEGKPLFPGVPIIASELSFTTGEQLDASPLRRFITGTIVGENMSGFMQGIFRLMPSTKYIALICGSSISDNDSEILFRQELEPFKDRIQLIDLTQLPLEEILQRVATLPPDTVVLYGSMFKDGAGNMYVPREVIPVISMASNAPVFGFCDSYMGFGIVGGHLFSFEEHGKETARLLLRVLAGEAADTIPWSGMQSYVEEYDWRELLRWGIPRSALPTGCELLNYTPTFWERYKWVALITGVVICVEFALIIALLINITRRRKLEQFLRDKEEQVRVAVEASGAGLWSLNLNTDEVWASDKAKSLHGLVSEEMATFDKFINAVHYEDRKEVTHFIKQAQASHEDTRGEWRLMQPDGSIRWIAVHGKIVSGAASLFLKGACIDITAYKQAMISLRQHKLELENLAGRLIHNQEEELRRLAMSLHDDLTQRLSALGIDIGLVAKSLVQLPAGPTLREINRKLSEITGDIHNLSRRLHPAILSDLGLTQAAIMECIAFQKRTCIRLTYSIEEVHPPQPFSVELCLYRVLQESLQNLFKYSQASEAYVSLETCRDIVKLTVLDFGIGFDVEQKRVGGIGLSSMRERVHLVNGIFTIDSVQGEGTMIEVCIPLRGGSDVSNENTAC